MIIEPIYNIDELINTLKNIRTKTNGNVEIYIKDVFDSDEYTRISDIRIDEDGDVIIENEIHAYD